MAKRVIACDGEVLLHSSDRDEFVEEHESVYGRARAEGLAMVWYNATYLGCRYPAEVEKLVLDWSRSGEKKALKRAAADGGEPPRKRKSGERNQDDPSGRSDLRVENACMSSTDSATGCSDSGIGTDIDCEVSEEVASLARRIRIRVADPSKTTVSELLESCQASRVAVEYVEGEYDRRQPGQCTLHVLVDGVVVAEECGLSRKQVKHAAAGKALERLRSVQSSLGIPPLASSITQADRIVRKEELVKEAFQKAAPISDNNKGCVLLRKMGWSGSGGLGKAGGGRTEPVAVVDARVQSGQRTGIGTVENGGGLNQESVQQLLNKFIASDEQCLTFSSDLSKENRALVHTLCQRMDLSHRSHGKGDNRQLLVQKKVVATATPARQNLFLTRTHSSPPSNMRPNTADGPFTLLQRSTQSYQTLNQEAKKLKSQLTDPFFGGRGKRRVSQY